MTSSSATCYLQLAPALKERVGQVAQPYFVTLVQTHNRQKQLCNFFLVWSTATIQFPHSIRLFLPTPNILRPYQAV